MAPIDTVRRPPAERAQVYQRYIDLLQGDLNVWTFGATITTVDEAWDAWLAWGIIPDSCQCRCGRMMRPNRDHDRGIGFRWECPSNRCPRKSARKGTFFEGAHIDALSAARLLFHFLVKDGLKYAAESAGLPESTAVDWFNFFREVGDVIQDHDYRPVGGDDDVVEGDESHLFTRKYDRGRVLVANRESLWVFGVVSRATGDMWVETIPNKSRPVLDRIMAARIAPNSWIMTDQHRSYIQCDQRLGMKGHSSVNHSERFVQGTARVRGVLPRLGVPVAGENDLFEVVIHTNTIERQWRELKKHVRTCRSVARMPLYIGDFLYRRNILRHHRRLGDKMERFLQDIRRVYPGAVGYARRVQRPGACACNTCRPPQVRRRQRAI